MCEALVYWVIFEKEGKNKQTIQVPLLYPAHEGIPRGMRWRSLSANQNRLNWGQRTNFPSDLIFLRSRLSWSAFFCSTELSGIRFGKIGWEVTTQYPSHTEVSGFGWEPPLTPVTSNQVHPSSIVSREKHVTTLKEVFTGPVCYVQKSIMQAARGTGCNNKFYYIPMLLNTCTGILRAFIHGWMKWQKTMRRSLKN